MNDKFDIIIIGAGIGELVSAALACKYGKKVLIVDKNPFAGGYVSSMTQNGFVFDQGITFISGVKNNGEFYKILEELDLVKKDEFKNYKYFQSLNQNTVGRSAFMLYLGTKIEIDSSNCYLSNVPEDIQINGFNHEKTGIAILIPSLIDPSMAPNSMHTLIIEVPAPYSYKDNWRITSDKSDDELLIDEVSNAVIKSAEKVIPNLSKNIVHKLYATPVSFEKLTYNREDSTMEWTKTPKNMQKFGGGNSPSKIYIKLDSGRDCLTAY